MHAVLGIDAAWTTTQPSGVALAVERQEGWQLVVASASYNGFHTVATEKGGGPEAPKGSVPSAFELLESGAALAGTAVTIVAIDMPLSYMPIIGRRISDNAVSKAYGGKKKCGTHTPNAVRPGSISDELRQEFDRAGYPLLTTDTVLPGLIEVYPHPALLALANAEERLPYKSGKTRTYWPTLSPPERRMRLFQQWDDIVALLDSRLSGVAEALPRISLQSSRPQIKAFEDALDAVVCVWVAICVLQGTATPFGDSESAIWIPTGR